MGRLSVSSADARFGTYRHKLYRPESGSVRTSSSSPRLGMRRANTPVQYMHTAFGPSRFYQDIIELGQIGANFSMDTESQYVPKPGSRYSSSTDLSQQSVSTESSSVSQGSGVVYPKRKRSAVVDFEHQPVMLLPKARVRTRHDIWDFVEGCSGDVVIPMDPRSTMVLTVPGKNVSPVPRNAFIRRASNVSVGSSNGYHSGQSDLTLPPPDRQMIGGDKHLESYANFKQQVAHRRMRAKSAPSISMSTCTDCPECAKLFDKFGSREKFLEWMSNQWGQGTELQNVSRYYSDVARGALPHYCNFVKRLRLHARSRDSMSPKPDHSHSSSRSSSRQRTARGEGQGDRAELESRCGIEGRPGSPSELRDDDRGLDGAAETEDDETGDAAAQSDRLTGEDDADANNTNRLGMAGGTPIRIPTPQPDGDDQDCPPSSAAQAWLERKDANSSDQSSKTENQGDRDGDSASRKDKSTDEKKPFLFGIDDSSDKHSPNSQTNASKDGQKGKTKKTKSVVKKKQKKSERAKKVKVKMNQEEESAQPDDPDQPADDKGNSDANVNPLAELPVPTLPEVHEKKPETGRRASRADRSSISFMSMLDAAALKPEQPESTEDKNAKKYEYTPAVPKEEPPVQKAKSTPSWLQGRLALSQQSSRFELPMDMKLLETMTPQEYLIKYCIISSRRQTLYQRVFLRHKDGKTGLLTRKDLEKALKDVLVNTATDGEITDMCDLVRLDDECKINYKLFAGFAAMAERFLYPKFLTEDTQDMKDHKKEKIESADFCALDWKFHGLHVNPDIRKLLEAL